MQTFRELLSGPEHPSDSERPSLTISKKSEIAVSGSKRLRLPKSIDAFGDLEATHAEGFPEKSAELLPVCRLRLLSEPHLAFEGSVPTDSELIALGESSDRLKRVGARRLVLATVVDVGGRNIFGEAEAIYLENGITFGSARLLVFRDRWTEDLAELAEWLARDTEGCVASMEIRPEANSPPWKTVALLLGGGPSSDLPSAWKRIFTFVAGLYCIALDIRENPDSSRAKVVADLKRTPPDALLVWARWIANPYAYIQPYKGARPSGSSQTLGQPRNIPLSFYEDVYELALHLDSMSTLSSSAAYTPVESWPEARDQILALECNSFLLTQRARDSLMDNAYPDPDRMYTFVRRLSQVAAAYAASEGRLKGGIVAMAAAFEIEIALHDDSRTFSKITVDDGRELDPKPHVKVDDAKSADKCGRIYFAIDFDRLRFVVDHIGLHDY